MASPCFETLVPASVGQAEAPRPGRRARVGSALAVFLRQLTLKGFKSFAETTVLSLEPGVTVVVGPNGSGKSNVVDAIAWVLGAQAPSSVRSQKMDDVIFAGTARRPALGRAEVSLTIDNSNGLLPIELTEITVTRTLWRSGDSEYAINGVPCRLLDVQELLSDSGVGRQQHVIVSQGQIDGVLNARPEDRRAVIEEAAGVLKYRKRKERAERRLDATEASLLRVQDLLREVRRQLRPLERQAEAARRHGEVVGELTALRIHLAGRDIASLQRRLEGLGAEGRELLVQRDRCARGSWRAWTPRFWLPKPGSAPAAHPTSAMRWSRSSSCASGRRGPGRRAPRAPAQLRARPRPAHGRQRGGQPGGGGGPTALGAGRRGRGPAGPGAGPGRAGRRRGGPGRRQGTDPPTTATRVPMARTHLARPVPRPRSEESCTPGGPRIRRTRRARPRRWRG